MARYGKFFTEQTTNAEDVMCTSDGGEYTDAVLRANGFYPIETVGDVGSANATIRYSLIDDANGGYIEERYTAQQVVRTFSKLKILKAAKEAGFLTQLIGFIESNLEVSYIWNASNVIEDNEMFYEYLPSIATALEKTEGEVVAFLVQNCIAD